MKKLFSLLLTVMLLMTCLTTVFADEDLFGKYEEPITITYLSTDLAMHGTSEYDAENPDRKSATENAWITGIKEYLNIDLQRIIAEDEVALNARINTGIASGDLPDIMRVRKDMFYVLAENGMLQELGDAYANYEHGDYLADIEKAFPDVLNVGTYEGQVLGYSYCGNFYNDSEVMHIRKDWLDKLGLNAPTTIDELIAVAQAFIDNKLGGDNTVGIEFYNKGDALMAPYGAIPGVWLQQDDGKYIYGDTTDGMKDALLKLQEIYKLGLIKSDFAVGDTTDEDIANGVCGILFGAAWREVTCVQTNYNNDPEAVWITLPIPTLDGQRVKQWTNAAINTLFCVNAKCEHPEALFKLIEFDNKMRFSADPDISKRFNVCEDGYQMWNLGPFRATNRADADLYKCQLITDGLANNTPTEEMDAFALSNYELCLKALNGDRAYLGRLNVFTDGYGIVRDLLAGGYLVPAYNGPTTENMTLYKDSINEALTSAEIKVIMGEDISVYENAVAAWYHSGGQAITDEVNEYYESLK